MKTFQRLCATGALALAFALPASAGEISTGPGVAPPPPPAVTAPGDMHTPPGTTSGPAGGEAIAVDPIAEVTLALLRSVLTLF